ncbi:kinase-like protein [Neolentinus lepideus HHB14362 ss-1]|uniref:Kinase-like protein n=1 Tax=Neolentinus lepideus HHB14362 ss-1 TaxID=1314782 RepID=A0A165WAC2_9AGAM|nr:kinase-like protein [Neolentinus lepideus HHB14362 ss-1]
MSSLSSWSMTSRMISSPQRAKWETSLRRITHRSQVLPPALFLDAVRTTEHFPVAGGGHSDIFRGVMDGQPVALKVLRTFQPYDSFAREQLQKTFYREAVLWGQLRHPNIYPFLGVCKHLFEKRPCMVSPWSYYGNITEFLEKHTDHDRLSLLLDVATGLTYLHGHDRKLVHGDLKGANILINKSLRACITDFGLSDFVESYTMTCPSCVLNGSLRWMPPEALAYMLGHTRSLPIRNPSGDVYSFACVCLEIYTGKPPWSDLKNEFAVIYEVVSGRRPAGPAEVPSKIWAPLIQSCWHQDPTARLTAENIVYILWGVRIAEHSAEFFKSRDIDHAESILSKVPVEHRSRLVSALAFKVIYEEDSDIQLVAELFSRVASNNICSDATFFGALVSPSRYLQDFYRREAEAEAWERMLIMMQSAGLVKDHWLY